MDTWTLVWLFWLGLFLVFEVMAVLTHKRTLSEQVWDWFSLRARKPFWLARRIVFAVFWTSLGFGHFMLGGPALWTVILPGIPFAAVIVYASLCEKRDGAAIIVVEGGAVEFSWAKSLWKGAQGLLEFVAAAALVAGVDALFSRVDEAAELAQLGVPAVAVGVVLFVVRIAVNYWKVKRATLVVK